MSSEGDTAMRRITGWVGAFAIVAIGIVALPLPQNTVLAEAWPQRMVRIILPVGSGAGTDLTARLYAERLAERWRQPVIVENRPGADGLIGTAAFAGTRDDHVLLFAPAAPISVYPFIFQKL